MAATRPARSKPDETPPPEPRPDRSELVEHETLTGALAAAQGQFPTIAKTQTATIPGKNGGAGYSYNYADLGDVLAAVRPVLSRHGLAIVQTTRTKDNGKTELLTELRHTAGETLESEVELGASPASAQQFGASLTYLRRYEVVTLLGIAAEEDRDAQDVEPPRPATAAAPAPAAALPAWTQNATDDRLRELFAALTELGFEREQTVAVVRTVRGTIDSFPDLLVAFGKLLAAERNVAVAHAAAEAPDAPAPTEAELRAEYAAADETQGDAAEPEDEPPADPDRPVASSVPAPDLSGFELDDPNGRDKAELALREAGCTCRSPLAIPDVERGKIAGSDVEPGAVDDACPLVGHGIPF